MIRTVLQRCVQAIGMLQGYREVLPRLIEFLVHYYTSNDRLHLVQPFLVHLYDRLHGFVPVSGIGFSTTKSPGYETLPNGERGLICWEAPVAITIFSEGAPLIGVGIEIVGDTLYIRQMQGVRGASFEGAAARHWPRCILEAAKEFAFMENFRAIRVRRAHTSLFFARPEYPPGIPLEERAKWKEAHQKRMRRRYDGTARQAGFVLKKQYAEWENENYARS